MLLFDLREPINALSHGAGMMLAIPVTAILWNRSRKLIERDRETPPLGRTRYQQGKALCLLVFGMCLMLCYGISATFHGVRLEGEPLHRLQRLDHVGIYLLIAATYTPVAWSLMRGPWVWGTLTTVWTVAFLCASRVWCGGVMPIWISTTVYLAMGWGALFCYVKLAETHSQRTLLPLPLGGVFYSAGAVLNLLRWPVLIPGVLAAHEMLHFFVLAGSACHIYFMMKVVVPAAAPSPLVIDAPSRRQLPRSGWESAPESGSRWRPHFPVRQRRLNTKVWVEVRTRAGDEAASMPPDNAARTS